jgi:hypothetical protein
MLGVMTVLQANVTWNAEIKVVTSSAGNELLFREFFDARVTSTSSSNHLGILSSD